MKTVEEVLAKRYERSAGKARVAADLVDMDKIQEKENERKALEQTALAEFLADRKSTRLNSSHDQISYAVFCLKKKKKNRRKARQCANLRRTKPPWRYVCVFTIKRTYE